MEGDRVHSLGELSIIVSIELLPTDRASNEINGDVGPRLSWDHQWTHVAKRTSRVKSLREWQCLVFYF